MQVDELLAVGDRAANGGGDDVRRPVDVDGQRCRGAQSEDEPAELTLTQPASMR